MATQAPRATRHYKITLPTEADLAHRSNWAHDPNERPKTYSTVRFHFYAKYMGAVGPRQLGVPLEDLSVTAPGVSRTNTMTRAIEIRETRVEDSVREWLKGHDRLQDVSAQVEAALGLPLAGKVKLSSTASVQDHVRAQWLARESHKVESSVVHAFTESESVTVAGTDPPQETVRVPSYSLEEWELHLEMVDFLSLRLHRRLTRGARREKIPAGISEGQRDWRRQANNVIQIHVPLARVRAWRYLGTTIRSADEPGIGQLLDPTALELLPPPEVWNPSAAGCDTADVRSLHRIAERAFPPSGPR